MTAPLPRLRIGTRLAYGVGDLGSGFSSCLLGFYLLPFLTDAAGLSASLAGWVLLIANVWDGVNDPLVGVLSDRTRSRFGRRYPWMVAAVPILAASFLLEWWVPPLGSTGRFLYYTGVAVVFQAAFTAVVLPYCALGAELTPDYDERTGLASMRFAFSVGGSLLSLVLAKVLFDRGGDLALHYWHLGLISCLVVSVPVLVCVAGTYGRARLVMAPSARPDEPAVPLLDQLRAVRQNRSYLAALGVFCCAWMSIQLASTAAEYFVRVCLRLPRGEFTSIALVLQLSAIACLPLWSGLSKRLGKTRALQAGACVWLVGQAGLFLLPAGRPQLAQAAAVLLGVGLSSAYLLPWAMIPDTIDEDELRTGRRREGLYMAVLVLVQKVSVALALWLLGQLLELAGYQSGVEHQPAAVATAVRVTVVALPTLGIVAMLGFLRGYPLTRQRHAEIRALLDADTGAAAAASAPR